MESWSSHITCTYAANTWRAIKWEVILAAVVGKSTPDIYVNMWQGNVEMYAKAKALIALDTLAGFLDFIYERCDSAFIKRDHIFWWSYLSGSMED